MLNMWLVYALLSMFMWGLWGVVTKVALTRVEWFHYYVYGSIATFIAVGLTAYVYRAELAVETLDFVKILVASGLGVLGYIFFVVAVKGGDASIVVPLTALYPVVTVVLGVVLLGEEMSINKLAGVILAVVAILLLSSE